MIISFLIELITLVLIAISPLIYLTGIIKNKCHILKNKARYFVKFLMFRTELVKIDNKFKKGILDMDSVYDIYITTINDFFLSIRNDYRYKIVNKLTEYDKYNGLIKYLTDNTYDPQTESKELKDEAIDLECSFEQHNREITIFREIFDQQLRIKISRDILDIIYEYDMYMKFSNKIIKSTIKNIDKYTQNQ